SSAPMGDCAEAEETSPPHRAQQQKAPSRRTSLDITSPRSGREDLDLPTKGDSGAAEALRKPPEVRSRFVVALGFDGKGTDGVDRQGHQLGVGTLRRGEPDFVAGPAAEAVEAVDIDRVAPAAVRAALPGDHELAQRAR